MRPAARRALAALTVVDLAGAAVAARHGVAAEPFGLRVGRRFDVRRGAVLLAWGSGLSAPLLSLPLAVAAERRRPGAARAFGAMWAAGAVSEPVFWGRRPCPRLGRVVLAAHVALALALARNGGAGIPRRSHASLLASSSQIVWTVEKMGSPRRTDD